MTVYYSRLFREILKAYYDNRFEEKINEILENPEIERDTLARVISALCGVDTEYSKNYIDNLKTAIQDYTADHKVVTRVRNCCTDCLSTDGKSTCERNCPFGAIVRDISTNRVYIDEAKCTDCGTCVESCPSNSLVDKVEFIPLANLLKENKTVIATVAPAIAGQFGKNVSINQLRTAIKKIGFTDMLEVAFFADMLTIRESIEFNRLVNSEDDFMISSCCCPVWVSMSKKIYSEFVPHVSPSVSPMIASGRAIKKINPECKVVFIGPCIAKKSEAKSPDLLGDIDYVLTFAELEDIFDILDIHPNKMEEDVSHEYASREGRLYGHTGGVSTAVSEAIRRLFPDKYELLTTDQAEGVKSCREMLDNLKNGIVNGRFLEGMGCVGGCVGGPKIIIPTEEGVDRLKDFAEQSEIRISMDSPPMKSFLTRLGIDTENFAEDEMEIFSRKF